MQREEGELVMLYKKVHKEDGYTQDIKQNLRSAQVYPETRL